MNQHIQAVICTTFKALHTPEKIKRLQRLHSGVRKVKQKMAWLQQKIAAAVNTDHATVDEVLDSDLKEIMLDSDSTMRATYPKGSLQRFLGSTTESLKSPW